MKRESCKAIVQAILGLVVISMLGLGAASVASGSLTNAWNELFPSNKEVVTYTGEKPKKK